jgi:hypothetical protein
MAAASASESTLHESDFECALCLRLMYEPCTQRCGHSFCRGCVAALVSHDQAKCPSCRRVLPVHARSDLLTVSLTLSKLLEAAFPSATAARALEAEAEAEAVQAVLQAERKDDELAASAQRGRQGAGASGSGGAGGGDRLPIFYLDSILPRQHLQLNVFEIRYRLMVRRCLEGSRRFGMIGPGGGGVRRLGTEVEITECQPQRDGRFHVEVVGRRCEPRACLPARHGRFCGACVGHAELSAVVVAVMVVVVAVVVVVDRPRRFEATDVWDEDGYAVAVVNWLALPAAGEEPEPEPQPGGASPTQAAQELAEQRQQQEEEQEPEEARVGADGDAQRREALGQALALEGLVAEWERHVQEVISALAAVAPLVFVGVLQAGSPPRELCTVGCLFAPPKLYTKCITTKKPPEPACVRPSVAD